MATGSSLSIRQLTLFNNGYGVFERQADVSGRGSIDLFFRESEMQDVLQSLCFSGGSTDVGNISYESTKQQPSIQLAERTPLVSLLRSLRGCRVALVVKPEIEGEKVEELEGQVLGVDTKLHGNEDGQHVTLLLNDGSELRTVPLSQIRSTKLRQQSTRDDLQHALDHAETEKKPDMQKLTIFYKDANSKRPLSVKYGLHVAEWQSSYRLVFLDESGRFRLDGFAIVKNTQEEDWNDIGLTLVVGNPKISKTGSSSGSKAGQITLEIRPGESHGATFSVQIHPSESVFSLKKEIERLKGIPVAEQRLIYAGKEIGEGRTLADYNITSAARLHLERRATGRATSSSEYESLMMKRKFIMAHQDGLSFYPIDMSVSAKRKQTAIVPLMQAELQGHHVAVYDDSVRKGNPLAAILFENTTGRTLDQGTLQVMNDKQFLGEGSMPSLGKGDESAPIPYAVEMGVEVSIGHVHKRHHAHEVKISDGSIFLYYFRQQTTSYTIKNLATRQLDFMLNHVFLDGWELYDHEDEDVQPVDVTDRVYQFRFDVAPCEVDGGVKKPTDFTFPVREQIISVKNISIERLTTEALDNLVTKGTIPGDTAVYKELLETIKIRDRVDTFLRMVTEKEAELREIKGTQNRLREHIQALGNHDQQSKKYVQSLSKEEDRLNLVEREIKSLKNDKKAESIKHQRVVQNVKYQRENIPPPPEEDGE